MAGYVEEEARVLVNIEINPGIYHLKLEAKEIAKKWQPGQFVNLLLPAGMDGIPFLRRPFSIFMASKTEIGIVYRVVGRGTDNLTQLKQGDSLNCLGPLGVPIKRKFEPAATTLFVAGGMGIASIAASAIYSGGMLLYGARTESELILLPEVTGGLAERMLISTEDGSFGTKGLVTDLLPAILAVEDYTGIVACGPRGMLKRVKEIGQRHNRSVYLVIEERMACGIGTCLACVIKAPEGYLRVCKDGPIFLAQEIVL